LNVSVVDASVAAKWLVLEPFREQALDLLIRHLDRRLQLIAPDHLWVELPRLLQRKVERGQFPRDAAKEGLRAIAGFRIGTFEAQQLWEDAFEIALDNRQTVYDAIYVVLALHVSGELITADQRLVNALGDRFPVRWLGTI